MPWSCFACLAFIIIFCASGSFLCLEKYVPHVSQRVLGPSGPVRQYFDSVFSQLKHPRMDSTPWSSTTSSVALGLPWSCFACLAFIIIFCASGSFPFLSKNCPHVVQRVLGPSGPVRHHFDSVFSQLKHPRAFRHATRSASSLGWQPLSSTKAFRRRLRAASRNSGPYHHTSFLLLASSLRASPSTGWFQYARALLRARLLQ